MAGMSELSRRDLCFALSAFAALPGLTAGGQTGEGATLSKSKTFSEGALTSSKSANGFVSRPVIKGVLATGETVEVHESTLPAGESPHPAHQHRHSEFVLVRDGRLLFDNDGTPEEVGPGGVILIASNVRHSIKNVGDVPSNYFVVGIGQDSVMKAV